MGTWPAAGPDNGREDARVGVPPHRSRVLRVEGDDPGAVTNHDPVALGRFGDHPVTGGRSSRSRSSVGSSLSLAPSGSAFRSAVLPSPWVAGRAQTPRRESGYRHRQRVVDASSLQLPDRHQAAEQRQAGGRRSPPWLRARPCGRAEAARVGGDVMHRPRRARMPARRPASASARTPTSCPWSGCQTTICRSCPRPALAPEGIGTASIASCMLGRLRIQGDAHRRAGRRPRCRPACCTAGVDPGAVMRVPAPT